MLELSSSIQSTISSEKPEEKVKNLLFSWFSKKGYRAELRWIAKNVEGEGIHTTLFVRDLADEMEAIKLSREAERALKREGVENVIVSLYPYHYKFPKKKK